MAQTPSTNPTGEPSAAPWPTPRIAWYGLGILLTAFLVSAVDRVILGMKHPLRIDR